MKVNYLIGICVILLILTSCGLFSDREEVIIKLDEYTVTVDYEPVPMGETDRVLKVISGRTLKIGDNKTAVFTSDSNLLSGPAYVYGGIYSMWLQRGLKDHWYIIFSRDPEGVVYDDEYDFSILPMNYSTVDSPVENLTLTLTQNGDEATFVISWGIHRFDTKMSLPPV